MIPADNLPEAVVARLQTHFPALRVLRNSGEVVYGLDLENLSSQEAEYLKLDIEFYLHNPHLPLENLCSRLNNYQPRTPSQQELLVYAHKLEQMQDNSRGAGLYMYGDAGIGKSHTAVGLGKLFMSQGLNPIFMTADSYSFDTRLLLTSGQVWIIDDLNSGYGLGSRLFKKVVLNVHDRGGRMFVTSNKPYDELLKEMFVGESDADRMRYDDRTRGMFKILHVQGDSFRQDTAWYT